MHKPAFPILLATLSAVLSVALLSSGCAKIPKIFKASPVSGQKVQRAQANNHATAPKRPSMDSRYRMPTGKNRSLTIYLSSQTFEYVEDGKVVISGNISSGSPQYPTPSGTYRILSKNIKKRSGSYTNYFDENTPMPYALQFFGAYYIHEGWLPGYADSHGCVRLSREDARLLYHRIQLGDSVQIKQQGIAQPVSFNTVNATTSTIVGR